MKKDSFISKINYIKILKIAFGGTVAILIADILHLKYSVACGIITLLTIQDTKRETIQVAFKRFVSFLMAAGLAFILFTLFDFRVIVFGLFLLFFVGLSIIFDIKEGISVNAVLTTHFLIEKY